MPILPVPKRILPLAAVLLFVASLAMPVAPGRTYPVATTLYGIEMLLKGWAGPLMFDLRWYANPVFAYAMHNVLLGRRVKAWRACAGVLASAGLWTLLGPQSHDAVLHWPPIGITELSGFRFLFGAHVWAASLVLGALALLRPAGKAEAKGPEQISG